MQPLVVTRRTTLPADRQAVWTHLADADLLGAWIGAELDVDLVPGAVGSVTMDDGRLRQIVVTHVEHEARVGFVWWDQDDPDGVSSVELRLDEEGDGSAALLVTETLDPAMSLTGAIGDRTCNVRDAGAAVAEQWGLRLGLLAGDLSARVVV